MYYSEFKTCGRNGWTHDFALTTLSPVDASGPDNFLNVWFATDPHRIVFSGGGVDLTSKGWTYFDYISVATITNPITPDAIKSLTPVLPKLISLHKRFFPLLALAFEFSAIYAALVIHALEHLDHDAILPQAGHLQTPTYTVQRFDQIPRIQSMMQELLDRVVNIRVERTDRMPNEGWDSNHALVTLRVYVDNLLGAVVRLDESIQFGRAWIRTALIRSMLDREPITMVRNRDTDTGRYHGVLYGDSGKETIL